MKITLTALLLLLSSHLNVRAEATIILVTGAPGEAEFAAGFTKQAAAWKEAAKKGGARVIEIGGGPEDKDKPDGDTLRTTLAAEKPDGQDALWLVLNGHGTWDGKVARFNLRGADVSADDYRLVLLEGKT